jgi:hypothetical protein
MVLAIHKICRMDSQDLARPIFHPFVTTFSIFSITGVAEVVVKLVLWSEPLHVLTLRGKVLWFALFNKSRPFFFCHIFILLERGVLASSNLHKLTLVAPPSMRDDLHSYFLSLLLHLFWIWNVCLNRVFWRVHPFHFRSSHRIPAGLMTPFVGQLDHKPWTISYSLSCPRVHLRHWPHQHSLRPSATSSVTLAVVDDL